MGSSATTESRVPTYLVATSGLLGLVTLVEVGLRLGGATTLTLALGGEFFVGVLTALPFLIGVGYAGYWLEGSQLRTARYRRVWLWTVAAVVTSLILNVLLMTVLPVASVLLAVAWLRWAATIGAGIGVSIGVTEARAIHNAMEAERTEVRAEQLEAQRDLLDYLNSLLRHEVLNGANVISGYATLLRDAHDPGTEVHEHAKTIHRKSEDVTSVVQDVRVLLRATEGQSDYEPVNVSALLQKEVEKVEDLNDSVEVRTSIPESVYVSADALLRRVFGNVLANAVEHNDSSPPRVSLRVAVTDETVMVDVEDNGSGISEDVVGTLFRRPSKRSAEHGLGLYLVDRLVQRYGGTVELAETGPDGSTFRLELPRYNRDEDATAEPAPSTPFVEQTAQPSGE